MQFSAGVSYWSLWCFLFCGILAEPTKDPTFIPLQNGRDLSGWVEMGEPGALVVEGEILALTNPQGCPNRLRTEREYEKFELSLEYRTLGWCESGILLHAPLYGRLSRSGIKTHLRHDDHDEGSHSVGGIYGVLSPLRLMTREEDWNQLDIYFNWPLLRVKLNQETIQDINLELVPELRWRLRQGFIGLQDLGRVFRC